MEAQMAMDLPNKSHLSFSLFLVSDSRSTEIETYSDMTKPKTTITRDSLSQILELKRFPQELIGELQKLDYLEKLEQRAQGQENKDEKDKKEGENEDENDGEEDIEEEPSDDDYFQNVEFDDDDDDFNDVDDGGEGIPLIDGKLV
ncbi:hypothetical protein CIPAW_04G075200 [Carya illinoinensis]|uniref:Uncharacterized protein n=1 Tax=Carya illinoinensis TaxID=32201 RepID=A0A8T1QSP7_CARIL|nr:hypothetical protein CIPAW_04G075200 [Carya illinoinensis]